MMSSPAPVELRPLTVATFERSTPVESFVQMVWALLEQ